MTHGGLAPPRPDQRGDRAPRGTVPGARQQRLGGLPESQDQLSVSQQAPTAFHTFQFPGRLFSAGLTYAVGANASYAGSVTQFYARLYTLSGLVMCSIQIVLCAPSTGQQGNDRWTGPDTGFPVAAGDMLILDVNNGTPVGPTPGAWGLMRSDCEISFTTP